MTGYAVVFNPSDTPQPVDDEGRILGGREWGVAHTASATAKDALDASRLVPVEVGDDAPANIVALRDRAGELAARADAFGRLEPTQLRKLADEHDIFPPDPPDAAVARHKADLVHALAMHPTAKPPRARQE